jgi:hypothetical protein
MTDLPESEAREGQSATTIQALGWLSAELAARADAWNGNAPDWFPEPPEWLELWERALDAVERGYTREGGPPVSPAVEEPGVTRIGSDGPAAHASARIRGEAENARLRAEVERLERERGYAPA